MLARGAGEFQTFSSDARSSNQIFNVIVAPGNSTLGLSAANSSPPVRVSNFNRNHKRDDVHVLQRTQCYYRRL